MRKNHKYIISVLLINILNIIYWICNYYPRHIFEVSFSVFGTILNVLYFIVYFYLLIVIFTQGRIPLFEEKNHYFETAAKRFHIKEFLILFGFQAVLEILSNIFALISLPWHPIASDLLTVIGWIAIYLFLTANIKKIKPSKTKLLVFSLLIALVVGASIFFDIQMAKEYIIASNKYTPLSPVMTQFYKNQQFWGGIKSLILDCVIASLLLVYHLSNQPASAREKERHDVPAFILQIGILLVAVFAVYGLKLIIYPDSTIKDFTLSSTQEITHKDEGHLDIYTEKFSLYRGDVSSDVDLCYQNNKTVIGDGENRVEFYWLNTEGFYLLDDEESHAPEAPNSVTLSSLYKEYIINGNKIYLYRKDAVSFYDNGEHRAILLKDLDSFEKNETVIKLFEQLLSSGNIFAFEYGCNYLLKYDRDFIEQYIKRYAAGEFTQKELTWLESSYYQKDYIIDIAKQYR